MSGSCPAPCKESTDGQDVTVTMTLEKDFLVPIPIPGFPEGVDLEAKGTFRCEFS